MFDIFNNGFPNYLIDEQIKLMINNTNKINDKNYVTHNNYNHINLFYCNQVHLNFKLDEKILKNIIHRYPSPIDNNNRIRFIIYNKKFKTFNLVGKKTPMLFINLYVHWENASPTLKKVKLY